MYRVGNSKEMPEFAHGFAFEGSWVHGLGLWFGAFGLGRYSTWLNAIEPVISGFGLVELP